MIKPVDGVMIEYEGRLLDGTVFDSSEGRGPAPMIAGQVIPGFAEALQKMQKGGRYAIRIPSALAYGATPPPGPIPPNADLEFDVHVVQVVPDAALMASSSRAFRPATRFRPRARPRRSSSVARYLLSSSSATLIVATIGSASSKPRIPNSAPNSNCAASTSAGARSTVRRAM